MSRTKGGVIAACVSGLGHSHPKPQPYLEQVCKVQGWVWLVVTLIQLVDQTLKACQLNQTKRLVGVWFLYDKDI